MMQKVSRILATVVATSVGVLVLVDLFLSTQFSFFLLLWASIIIAVALVLGVVNLLRLHVGRIQALETGWVYSLILVLSFAVTLLLGYQGPDSRNAQAIFTHILYPLESTFFALVALFIATAAFRAFRVKDFETLLLVTFAIIVLLGQVPIGFQLWSDFPLVKTWILQVPTLAGVRGILLGVALGAIATSIRILLGTDRPYIEEGGR